MGLATLPVGCWLITTVPMLAQSISHPQRAHAPMGHPVLPGPIEHKKTQRSSRDKCHSSHLIQTQILSDTGFLQGQIVTLPAGNQDTALEVCFKYSSPHAHPSLYFWDQSNSFWKEHVCHKSDTVLLFSMGLTHKASSHCSILIPISWLIFFPLCRVDLIIISGKRHHCG